MAAQIVPIGGEMPAAAPPPSAIVPVGGEMRPPDFKVSNEKDAAGNAVVDPDSNSLGTFFSHLVSQVNPIAAVRAIGNALPLPEALGGKGLSAPLDTLKSLGAAQGAVYDKALASYRKGDYATAARHFVDYLIPLAGPALDKSSDLFQAGKWAAGGGDAIGLGLQMFGPEAIAKTAPSFATKGPLMQAPNPADAAAVSAGQAAGVPVDVATATGNKFVRGVQSLADRSLGGSFVAQKAQQATDAAMGRWGDELADQARGSAITPEQAGQGVRDALQAKIDAHKALADRSYESLREMEADPANRMAMPGKPAPVDALSDTMTGQLRRIVHEMDAAPYTPRILRESGVGSDLEHVPGTGGAGAAVFDDIGERSGSTATRGRMQQELEEYLGGGPETPNVKAALEVAELRNQAKGGSVISKPELPPSAMNIPTRLEGSRVTTEDMGFPVDLTGVKKMLQPVYDQMRRQLPPTQQQANPGLNAIGHLLEGPDFAPLSQTDRDLSAIKTIARENGGLAKIAVSKLDAAVQDAAAAGGDQVLNTLKQGRQATAAMYETKDLLDKLPSQKFEEPLPVYKQATAPKDAGIEFLRTLNEHTPQAMPQLARAKLEDLMSMGPDKAAGEWSKLGDETKSLLFPDTGHAQQLDQFFTLRKRLATNPNPSGTALTAAQGAEGLALFTHPAIGAAYSLSAPVLSAMLHSPTVAEALTRAMKISLAKTTPAMQAGAVANLVKAAQDAGIPLQALPAGAGPMPAGQTQKQ